LNILHEIAERTKERVEAQKKLRPLERVRELAESAAVSKQSAGSDRVPLASDNRAPSATRPTEHKKFVFEGALTAKGDISFICEIKKASPSKGTIASDFPYVRFAKEYEAAGATAISVLTEPFYFQGHDKHLREIADEVSIPLLRKDFTVDDYMIYEAKILGASAVLLICSILESDTLAEYISIAHSIGLSALVETHDEKEIDMALKAGARIIGVNNRDLKTFEIDLALSEKLRKFVDPGKIFVAESGIKTPEDVEKMRQINANAVLIGEAIMQSKNKYSEILNLRGKANS